MTQLANLISNGRWGVIAARSASVVVLTAMVVACSSNQKIAANSKRPVTLPPTIKAVKPDSSPVTTAQSAPVAATPSAGSERSVSRASPEQNVPAESVSFEGKETKYDYKNDPDKTASAGGDSRNTATGGAQSSAAAGGGNTGSTTTGAPGAGGTGSKPSADTNAANRPSAGGSNANAGAGAASPNAGAGGAGPNAGAGGAAGGAGPSTSAGAGTAGGAGGAGSDKPQVAAAPDSKPGGAAGAAGAGGPGAGGAAADSNNVALADREAAERKGRVETADNKVLIEQDERLQTLDGSLPMALNMDEQGQFDFDRYLLRDEVKGKLDELADKLKNAPYDKLHILGFTDRIGSPDYNQKLSEKRAWAVAGYLMEKGVPPYKLRVEGRGRDGSLTNPEDCKGMKREQMIECLQRDRRVEILATVKEYNLKVQ